MSFSAAALAERPELPFARTVVPFKVITCIILDHEALLMTAVAAWLHPCPERELNLVARVLPPPVAAFKAFPFLAVSAQPRHVHGVVVFGVLCKLGVQLAGDILLLLDSADLGEESARAGCLAELHGRVPGHADVGRQLEVVGPAIGVVGIWGPT